MDFMTEKNASETLVIDAPAEVAGFGETVVRDEAAGFGETAVRVEDDGFDKSVVQVEDDCSQDTVGQNGNAASFPHEPIVTGGVISERNNDSLFYLYRDSRDIAIRNEIVGRHMYLIDIISRKFINRGVEYEDLCQIASIALIKAVERFDLGKGVKFVSFATPTIVGEIKRYFRDKGSTIRIPRRIYEIYQKVNQAKEYLSQSLSRTPMVSDIAEYLKISEENVLEIIESWNVYNIQSFEQNAFSEDNLELRETIGEDDFEFEKIENRDFIEKSMAKFSESEREFINLRYMNDMTQKQIATVMNVSQMYISRLEKKIIRKFRLILEK